MASQGVFPMLAYEDGPAVMDWLSDAFGFVELKRIMRNGLLAHGEMETGSGIVMMATPSPDYQSPRRHREKCAIARAWLSAPWVIDGVMVYVKDVESHYKRAVSAGASTLSGIEEGSPGRRYRVEDLEGHRWMFIEPEAGAA